MEEKLFFIKLENLETVNALCSICNKYKDKMDVDVKYGKYVVDGCSILMVAALMGNIVKICPDTKDRLLIEYFYKDLKKSGGYKVKVGE